jgi:hypothetical protein
MKNEILKILLGETQKKVQEVGEPTSKTDYDIKQIHKIKVQEPLDKEVKYEDEDEEDE